MSDLEQIEKQQRELSRLTEKYSQPCDCMNMSEEEFNRVQVIPDCEKCHGTGRVWMLGVEEIEKMQKDVEDERHEWFNRACNRILGGK
jgi:type II secretory ATPase GspE/PulE/Tfp pilus assembly ATPase PilB-like protein